MNIDQDFESQIVQEAIDELLQSQRNNPAWSKAELWGIERDIVPELRLIIKTAIRKLDEHWRDRFKKFEKIEEKFGPAIERTGFDAQTWQRNFDLVMKKVKELEDLGVKHMAPAQVCRFCGKVFARRAYNQLYCSNKCRHDAVYKRRKKS